ncbi:MAG: Hdr-like menaquinol oxidoreductase cytochrome c subunit [Betaproteobacteria bacterium]|nr:Hdr-like menaquinol oxidoreductase cytochrome c subunit [Betaproteobacteria bacterium]
MRAAGILRAAIVATLLLSGSAMGPVASAAGPALDPPRSGPCVEDPKLMRRSHMEFLRHDRDDTVRRGIRPVKHSLAACVDCHANAKDGQVLGSEQHFCQGCHSYAAVKPDCFGCHASTARPATTASAGAAGSLR